MEVCNIWIFFLESFLEMDFIFQWMGGSFSVGDSFLGGEGTPIGVASALMGEGGQKN